MFIKNQEKSRKLLNKIKKMHDRRKFGNKKFIGFYVPRMKFRENWNYFK